ncbi:MAG: arylesterase [Alphaproteobacteria bacterium]|nr:arylesterase [Alphaproteobacteria bacterium]
MIPAGAAAAEPVRIAILGDSIAAGFGLAPRDALDSQLARALGQSGHSVRVINAGVSGDTTAGGLARLDWMLADRPAIVIVELGGNDGLRGIDPRASEANLDAIVARLRRENIRVLLAGMLAPPNLGPEYGADFNAVFPRVAARHGVAFYPFILEGVAADPALNQPDGIHPNARGVRVIVERLLPHVERFLPPPRQG